MCPIYPPYMIPDQTPAGVKPVSQLDPDPVDAWGEYIKGCLAIRDGTIGRMRLNRVEAERLNKEHKQLAVRQGYMLKKAQDAMVIYGQFLCRPLCDQMHACLPRELRDRIYGYLLGPRGEDPTPWRQLISQRRQEIWRLIGYVGREFIEEICEMAYRTDNLLLCDSFNLQNLLFSPPDSWVLPATHIRSLVLRVNLNFRRCNDPCCAPNVYPSRYGLFPPGYSPEELSESMEPLLKIEHKVGFKLEIRICDYTDEKVTTLLEAMRDVLLKLKQAGMRINIRREVQHPHGMFSNRYPKDLMVFYDGSMEDWERVCSEHKQQMRMQGVQLIPPSPPPPPPPPTYPIPPVWSMPPHPPVPIGAPLPTQSDNSDGDESMTEA